ncbi:glucose-6-phosphate 1-dehydrogenase [Pullulanibacillus pueri]|uniref:Glucose-6-phosphate 1-dehydrogenase n=1 Tax=Pullulanibacillus pueri TaxID=1437324 RepID=A0A8J2ZVL4_9BACL|nr:glucose-6-phosphate dehydrogenase [Pullulanibacillus pueri]MBM7682312.1 glucose-6-phosphate 1-dehydrogenase [Pullulanibacillus pueri]GGH80838.1 glucose-6-phosphate 1-dehydrogenase [Pullulanibacillus pueri]
MNLENSKESTIILFGATGDLAVRKLYPALYQLYKKQNDVERFAVIGLGRRKYDHDTYRNMVKNSVKTDDASIDDFLSRFFFYSLDVDNIEGYVGLGALADKVDTDFNLSGNRIFYLALAPNFFGTVTNNLKDSGLTNTKGWKRLVIEKPFGHNLSSAKVLNEQIRSAFAEEEIYRIDHYLGKEMVQNIQVIRFANPLFESIWNNRYISNIQITSSETLGVGERAGYYDRSGALMDMVQNHMLQMVALTAMEPPSRLETEDIRDEKVKVLRSIRPVTSESVKDDIIRAQYTSGVLADGQTVRSYLDEENIDSQSQTETFVGAKLYIDNFRWAGVPFYIRTGKRMGVKSTQIVIQFKDAPLNPYLDQQPNLLVIHVQPDEGLSLKLNAKKIGESQETMPIHLDFCHNCTNDLGTSDAYERLIHDCIRGDSTNFTRWDEVALSWTYVDSIAQAWKDGYGPLEYYESGTMGPKSVDDLLAKNGFHWWPITNVEHN